MSRSEDARVSLRRCPLPMMIAAMLMLSGCAGYKELKAPCSPDEGTPLTSLGPDAPMAYAELDAPGAVLPRTRNKPLSPGSAAPDLAAADRCGPMKPI